MATENSPPQIRIILTAAFSSIVILAALNSVFRSYYLMMTEEVEHAHLATPTELIKLRAGEHSNLTTSPLPIAQAMQQLASRGRTNNAAFADQITPLPSNDPGARVGWVKAPNQAVIDELTKEADNAPPEAAVADGGTAAVDGGAHVPTPPAAPGKAAAATHDAGAH